jgi:mannose-6-phosphate isomerase-like protein (cupin superfamily)
MKVNHIDHMVRGWFVGAFSPAAWHSPHVEVGYRVHAPGIRDWHYHTHVTEVNLIISGEMIIQGRHLKAGDIFELAPYEVTNPEFLTPCGIVCVKFPSVNDKISIPTPES